MRLLHLEVSLRTPHSAPTPPFNENLDSSIYGIYLRDVAQEDCGSVQGYELLMHEFHFLGSWNPSTLQPDPYSDPTAEELPVATSIVHTTRGGPGSFLATIKLLKKCMFVANVLRKCPGTMLYRQKSQDSIPRVAAVS